MMTTRGSASHPFQITNIVIFFHLVHHLPLSLAFLNPATVCKSSHRITSHRNPSSYHSHIPIHAKREKFNPFTSMFNDVTSSLFGKLEGNNMSSSVSSISKTLPDTLDTIIQYSWDDVRSLLESKQTPSERNFRSNVEKGIGSPSPLNKIRTFSEDVTENDIRVTFYRDHASWCPYCQKVWMTLEEKKIPYRIEKVNMRCYGEKESSFLRLQPSGNIPIATIDGTTYKQSNDIMYALEQTFPNHKPLLPPSDNTELRMKAQELLRLERQLFSSWMYWLTGSERSRNSFMDTLRIVEKELSVPNGGDFFLGKDVSLVDMMFAPFLERTCASLLFFKGFQIRYPKGVPNDFPAINKWFDAMETLESYQLTKSDYYTHAWDLPPQLGGCTYEAGGEVYERAINGERSIDGTRGSWELPLVPHNGGIEPDWDWCGDDQAACREAVERVSFNYKNIVNFAARGAGQKGFPAYMAPLADPNAVPNEAVKCSVDCCLRVILLAMLEGADEKKADMEKVAAAIVQEGGDEYASGVIASLAYLRDRTGVPRDMRLPAARQLRAHLNWSIEHILNAQSA